MSGSTCVLADVRGKKLRRSSRIRSINTRLSTATFSRRPLFTGHPARLATNSLRDIHQAHDHYRDFQNPPAVVPPSLMTRTSSSSAAAIVSVCTVTAMLRRGKFGGASTSHVYTHSTTSPHNLWFSLGTVPYFSTESRHGRRTPASRRGPVSRPSMFGLIRQYTIDERSCRAPR